MEEELTFTECEKKFVREEGYDPAQAAEICANAEGRFSDEETRRPRQEEDWGEYWADK
jgi:hypothetical protein